VLSAVDIFIFGQPVFAPTSGELEATAGGQESKQFQDAYDVDYVLLIRTANRTLFGRDDCLVAVLGSNYQPFDIIS